MASILFRAHEWLADRVPGIQYPQLRRTARPPFFKHQMPWPKRVLLVLIGLWLIIFSAIAMLFLGLFFWGIFTA